MRISAIDTIRGANIILMVFYHFMYNLTTILDFPRVLLRNPFMDFLQIIIAGTFIILCGISSTFSKSNTKRGVKLLIVAFGITVVTYLTNNDLFVRFGIIHFLAVCVITYSLIEKRFSKLKLNRAFPIVLFLAFAIHRTMFYDLVFEVKGLSVLGFTHINYLSADYFPIIPWIFLFYIGIYLGGFVKQGDFHSWFYKVKCKPLEFLGKKSLEIYVLHQPIMIGFIYLHNLIAN